MKLTQEEQEFIQRKRSQETKKEKHYKEASKKLMFLIMILVFIVFFVCLYLSIVLKSVILASHTLDRAVIFSAPVLTALIAKSGFENIRKGKTREQIIMSKIANLKDVELGEEDFRNSI